MGGGKWGTLYAGGDLPVEVPVIGLQPWRASMVNYLDNVGSHNAAGRAFAALVKRIHRDRRGRWWWK